MKISLPLEVFLPRKRTVDKKFILNLNNYRNAYFIILNDAKVAFKDEVLASLAEAKLLKGDRPKPPLAFKYVLYPKTKRKSDLGNVLSIVQKFTDDALTELGVIPEDNYEVIQQVTYAFGHVDKANPRAELTITEASHG
jgi:hypothetical protein